MFQGLYSLLFVLPGHQGFSCLRTWPLFLLLCVASVPCKCFMLFVDWSLILVLETVLRRLLFLDTCL